MATDSQANNYKQKWNDELNLNLNTLAWKNIYKICFSSIKDNFLIWFQYKIIHRLTGTNLKLYKMKKSDTSVCGLCQEYDETFLHLFIQCPKSIEFWRCLKNWIYEKLNKVIAYTPQCILFGTLELISPDSLVNVTVITGKYYILKCARSKGSIDFHAYEKYLRNVYKEQLMLARMEMYAEKFSNKWSLLNELSSI